MLALARALCVCVCVVCVCVCEHAIAFTLPFFRTLETQLEE
jgi:hypothetical protein